MIPASTQVLLDTNILIHLARGGVAARWLESEYALGARRATPLISTVTLGEMMAFAMKAGWGAARQARLKEIAEHLVVVDISREPVLRAYAEFDAELTRAGTRMGQQNDLWIAATAAATGAVVLTTDKDVDVLHPTHIRREWVDPHSLR